MRRLLIGTVFLAVLGISGTEARASKSYVSFNVANTPFDQKLEVNGMPFIKNLYVDVIFWGFASGDPGEGQVLNDIQDIATWLNSGWVFHNCSSGTPPCYLSGKGAGWDPAVHQYGVSGITPGLWVEDTNAIPLQYVSGQGNDPPDHGAFETEIDQAVAGNFGTPRDFQGNLSNSSNFPAGSNRLVMVITKGTNQYCNTPVNLPGWASISAGLILDVADIVVGSNGPSLCEGGLQGFHGWRQSQGQTQLYGAAFGDIPDMSHEIMEAMTDPFTFGGWTGVDTDIPLYYTGVIPGIPLILAGEGDVNIPDEIADDCTDGKGDFSALTVDVPYDMTSFGGGVTAAASCQKFIPEQHAPMAAKIEYANGQAPVSLVYIDTNGHLQRVIWAGAGQLASNPVDLGQPSDAPGPIVKATGKPSIVFDSRVGGERVFVKGTDQGVWMHYNNSWTPLGGLIYGDPQAVVWSWQGLTWTHVFVLGPDDNIYANGIANNTPYGWGAYPDFGTRFVGSPAVLTRDGTSLDVFAVGEDGGLKQMSFTPAGGWAAPVAINRDPNHPYGATPAVAQLNQATTELVATLAAETGNGWMQSAVYNGAQWQGWNWGFQLSTNSSYGPSPGYGNVANYGFQGTPAVVGGDDGGFGRADIFVVTRTGELFWYYSINGSAPRYGTLPPTYSSGLDDGPLVDRDVTGDPVAISRGTGELEVLYRTSSGAIGHITINNGAATPAEIVVPNGPFMQ